MVSEILHPSRDGLWPPPMLVGLQDAARRSRAAELITLNEGLNKNIVVRIALAPIGPHGKVLPLNADSGKTACNSTLQCRSPRNHSQLPRYFLTSKCRHHRPCQARCR
jgi:hypothetical protein